MGFPNDLPALTNPTPSDPMSAPSHATSEHSEENNAIMALARMWRTKAGTDLPIVNLRGVSVGGLYAPGDGTNQSTYVQAAVDLLPYYGGVVLCPPGAYGLAAEVSITNKGAVYFLGLAGKRYVSPTVGGTVQQMGVRFQGLTGGMQMFSWHYASGSGNAIEGLRGGPYFENIAFEDPARKQFQYTVTAGSATGTAVTLTIATGHPFIIGDVIYVKDTYPTAGDIVVNGAWTITAKTATTVTFNVLTAPSGNPTVFGQVSYDLIPNISIKGLLLDGVSRWGFKRCSFSFLAVGVDAQPAAGASVNDGNVEKCSFVYDAIGVRGGASGEGAFTTADCDFTVGSNQTGVDFVDGTWTRTRDNRFIIGGGDTSGQGSVGILLRKGTHFKFDGDKFDMDVRVGTGTGILVGTEGRAYGSIVAPSVKAKHIDARNSVGVYLQGFSATQLADGCTVIGGTYEGTIRGVHFGQYSRGNQLIGGGFSDFTQGIRLSAGATNNMLIAPSRGDAVGGLLVSDAGTDTQWLGVRDAANGQKATLRLATQAAPALPPPSGVVEIYADAATGKPTVLHSDGTTASMEGGGGGTTGAMSMKASLTTGPLTLIAGDNIVCQWSVPAGYVAAGFACRFVFWGLAITDATAVTMIHQLSVGGSQRGQTSHAIAVANIAPGASWRTEGEMLFKGATGASGQNANFTDTFFTYNGAPSGAASQSKALANSNFAINGASTAAFVIALVVNLSSVPAGDIFTAEGAMIWAT